MNYNVRGNTLFFAGNCVAADIVLSKLQQNGSGILLCIGEIVSEDQASKLQTENVIAVLPYGLELVLDYNTLSCVVRDYNCTSVCLAGALDIDTPRKIQQVVSSDSYKGKVDYSTGLVSLLYKIMADNMESLGVSIVSSHDLLKDYFAIEGCYGAVEPSEFDLQDIIFAKSITETIAKNCCGQCAVVNRGICTALESSWGTDIMLRELAEHIRMFGDRFAGGLLYKNVYPGVYSKIEIPAIGLRTMQGAVRAGLRGIAVAAGRVLLFDKDEMCRMADDSGLFIYGY